MEQKNEKVLQKNSATIFQSQLDLIKTLTKNQQIEVIYALFDYEMYGIEPKSPLFQKNGVVKAIWIMSKPLIDKRLQWVENGRKGGRPKSSRKPNQNQMKTKPKPNQNQTKSKAKADRIGYGYGIGEEYTYPNPSDTIQEEVSEDIDMLEKEDENYVDIDWDSIPEP